MRAPEGFFTIYQPKHKIPGIYDLNERGMFRARPFVTKDYGYRVIMNEDLSVKMQLLCLKEKTAQDPRTGVSYNHIVDEILVDLDEVLRPIEADTATGETPPEVTEEILAEHEEWRKAFIPTDENQKTDKEALKQKLRAALLDRKEIIRKDLVRKNSTWVTAAMSRLVQDFLRGLYLKVEDCLYEQYRQMDGMDTEKELIKKILLFHRVYDCDNQDPMRKPDGGSWKSEDEVWECWIGFAGSEGEAKRVCRTMEAVFRPLKKEMTEQGFTAR